MRKTKRIQKSGRQPRHMLRTVATFAIGATVGSLIALFYAPASGKVTRRRLAMRVRGLQRATVRRIEQTQRALARRAENVREAASEWFAGHTAQANGRHPVSHRVRRHAHAH